MTPPRSAWQTTRRALLRGLQAAFFVAGGALLTLAAGTVLDPWLYEVRQSRLLAAVRPGADTPICADHGSGGKRPAAQSGEAIGYLQVPRLDLSALVAEGTDPTTLRRAIGHVTGTALPGEAGNMSLAAHRDTFFRPLRDIRPADTLRVVTRDQTYAYTVDSTLVVSPDRVDLLEPTDQPGLTLITCYPFHYIGPAPQRFIVRATLIALDHRRLEPGAGSRATWN